MLSFKHASCHLGSIAIYKTAHTTALGLCLDWYIQPHAPTLGSLSSSCHLPAFQLGLSPFVPSPSRGSWGGYSSALVPREQALPH